MAIRFAWRRRSVGSGPSGADAFRADTIVARADRPSSRQASAMLATLVVVAAGIGVASYTVRPETARTFDLVHGSVFLTDQSGPVGVDFATGLPTLRLIGADKQVGADRATNVSLVPVTDGTLMVDTTTGQFNMVDDTGFVIKHNGGGVLLPARTDRTTSSAVAADGGPEAEVAGAAYILRTGVRGTDVLLVNQSAVEIASAGRRVVTPRAQYKTSTPAVAGPNALAGANGDLWALVGTGDQHQIMQLSVPLNSDTGARLLSRQRGVVDGPAAVGTATTNSDGSGGTAVAVASGRRIAYFPADGSMQRDIAVPDTAGVDEVLPVSGGRGRFAFLLHGTQGWSLVTLTGDGAQLHGPIAVRGLSADARPARPTWSEGQLYTIDTRSGGDGGIYRIDAEGTATVVRGATDYPIASQSGKTAETRDFSDAYVVSRGTRVLVNSPSHAQAVALFTDGAHRPLIIRKSSAVDVSVAGGAEALTRADIDPSDERSIRPNGTAKQSTSGTQINNQVDCMHTVQKPHIPVLRSAAPSGSRSATLAWNYPTLGDPQACYPTTWIVRATVISGDAAAQTLIYRITGQSGAFITGLSPQTTYSVTVTAYLHRQGAESAPIRIITAAEGPAAPTGLRVLADSSGGWTVAWNGCGSGRTCVPVDEWQIVPTVCDGLGVSSPPKPLDVGADSSTRVQAVYSGGTGLLGRGLSFQVVGLGSAGQTGRPSASSGCVYSWRPPDAGAVAVAASQPASPSADGTTSITVSVNITGSAVAALGGTGGTLTYQLLSGGSVIDSVGPTTDTSVRLDNIAAGRTYSVEVTASPPRHPEVVVAVGTAAVQPAVAVWPTVDVSTRFDAVSATAGTLEVTFDLGGTSARGEHFDLVNSLLTCGNATLDLSHDDVVIGQHLDYDVNRFNYNGNCNVAVQLRQNDDHSTDPPLFGAGPSGTTTAAVTIAPPDSTATKDDFTAEWVDDASQPTIKVSYHGTDDETLMSNWSLTATNGSTANCGTTADQPPPASIPVVPACITQGGAFTVSVDYSYEGSKPHFDIAVTGTEPRPIDPDLLDFGAMWGGDVSNPTVNVSYTGTEVLQLLLGASWTETVVSDQYPGVVCGSDVKNPGSDVISVAVDLGTCAPGQVNGVDVTYQVTVAYSDVFGNTWSKTYAVDGEPPS